VGYALHGFRHLAGSARVHHRRELRFEFCFNSYRVLTMLSISPGDSLQVINSTADYSQIKWSVEQGKDRFASKLAEPTAAVHEEL
jgi:hypothetical protein